VPYLLEFETFLPYDQGLDGITVQTTIGFSDSAVTFPAKIDTGSSVCIFERSHGESLGLEIESGVFQRIGTATGTFNSYGFHVALKVAGLIFDSLVFFPENEHIKKNILGRHGWLELVKLGLVDYEGKLYLSKHA